MTLYNATAEVEAASAVAVEACMTDELTGPFHAVLHASEHRDEGLAITLTLDSFGPGMAASMAVDVLSAFGIRTSAVEAMETVEFDRRNDLAAF